MNVNWRGALIYLIILVAAGALILGLFPVSGTPNEIPLTQLAADVNARKVASVTVEDGELEVVYKGGQIAASRKEASVDLTEALLALGAEPEALAKVDIEVEPPSPWGGLLTVLGTLLPFLLLAGLFFFLMRQAQGTNNQALSFGKSRARMFTGEKPTVTFDDVAGVEEAKQELAEVVEFLKEPQKFIALGARIPKGVVLMGLPGTGKTLMAKAVSGEAGVPFFSISGSEFVEMFVGVGAARVRDLFDQAKRNSPCIIFVDEVDAVGRHRGAGLGGSHDEREQTLNQILVEMDGFGTDTNIIVIAATNRPDILDPALLRPGRFDRRVVLDRPDIRGRRGILDVHVRGKPLGRDVDLDVIARGTPGFVGADIENLVNEAAILAARRNKKAIGAAEFQEAIERVIAGPERKSRLITDEEKEILAYHEAGHALVQSQMEHCDPVHKVSIVARGMNLGYTMALPERDYYLYSQDKFEDEIAGMLAGRAAEEMVFGDKWTGAGDDLEKATKVARKMVTAYGMSRKMGPLTFGDRDELVFLGREIAEQRNYSDEVAEEIDQEVRRIIDEAYARARDILVSRRDTLGTVARRLIQVETIERQEFEALIGDRQGPSPQQANQAQVEAAAYNRQLVGD
ncbi:MAG: ATP-dependent zinc metalloprotease FtsH [Anaerolineae bacterium]|nr:ATP-dependent zinc metalloprotease FtsH [Anaerolineae bacterium]